MKRREEAADAGPEATAIDLLERAESVRILQPAQDVVDGVLWYGLPADDALVVITSTRQAYRADRLPEGIGLRHTVSLSHSRVALQKPGPPMADLKPRIDELVGRLVEGRDSPTPRPAGGSSPELRPGDVGFASAVARLVAMPLDRYAREGAPLEIWVRWHGDTLWPVSDESQGESLVQEGVSRGRIWTAGELMPVFQILVMEVQAIRMIGLTKSVFDGEIAEVRRQWDNHARF